VTYPEAFGLSLPPRLPRF